MDQLRSDGSFQYSRQFLAGTPPPRESVGDGSYKIDQPYVDPTVVEGLYSGLTVLTRTGVHVVFVFLPYHPHVMACQNAAVCASMAAVERAIGVLAGRVGADVIGSFDPRPSALEWRDFYDDMHLSAQALRRLKW